MRGSKLDHQLLRYGIFLQAALGLGPLTILLLIALGATWVPVAGEFVLADLTAGLSFASMTLAFIGIIKKSQVNSEALLDMRVLGAVLWIPPLLWTAIIWPYYQEVVLACQTPGAVQRCLESQAIGAMIRFILLSLSVPAAIITSLIFARIHPTTPPQNRS